MTIGPSSKKKKRRSSIDNGDLDTSSSSRSLSDLSRTRTRDETVSTTLDSDVSPRRTDTTTTTDTRTTNGDASRVRRDSSFSDTIATRQRQISDAQRSRTLDDLDASVRRDSDLVRRDSDSESTASSLRDDPTSVQRRRSLSDLAATIDTEATIPDLRPLRARRLAEGDLSAFRQKRFDEDSLSKLLENADRTDVSSSPLVRELSLDDSSRDADEADFVDDVSADVDVAVRRSSYSQDESQWISLPKEANDALRSLQTEFEIVTVSSGPERYLTELLPNIYADDGQTVSPDILNDVYFLAKEQITRTTENPLLDADSLPDAEKLRIQRLIELVKAIDKMESRKAFLVPENARAYNALKLETTNLGATSLTTHERQVVKTYGSDLTGISFNRTQPDSEIHKAISDYRQKTLERLTTDLQALEGVFQDKLIKKEHHHAVLKAQAALGKAIDRIKGVLDTPTDPNTADAVDQLNLAIDAMKTAAQTYLSIGSKDKKRIQSRLDACQIVLDRLDQLTVTDDKIVASRLNAGFRTLENTRQILGKYGPKVTTAFDKMIEDFLFNASPDANIQTILDSLSTALGLAELDSGAASSSAFQTATDVSIGPGTVSDVASVLADVAKTLSFIKGLKKAGVVTKTDALNGGLILLNATKNVSGVVETGFDIAKMADSALATSATASASIASGVAGGAGIVIGGGFTVHGGYVAYKTGLRVQPAEGIGNDQIRAQILDRIQTKRRRAILKAVGGAVAVVGGVVAIVATAGAATPVVIGIGAGIAALSTGIGAGLSGERAGSAIYKRATGTKGSARMDLAIATFVHMNELLASGNYSKAKELAQALTNNKLKQSLMLRGADAGASPEDKEAARMIMFDKLKTW